MKPLQSAMTTYPETWFTEFSITDEWAAIAVPNTMSSAVKTSRSKFSRNEKNRIEWV